MSTASAQAAEARRRANTTVGYYNLKLGPTAWRFAADMGLEYNSNVRYTEDGEGDFITRPGIDARVMWPVTEKNSLNLDIAAGYSFYTQDSDLSRWYITPGSALSFDVYVGDFTISLHDRFAIQQDSYQDPTVAGGDFAQFENAAGISAIWDLNKLKLRGGYDHINFMKISGEANRPDGQQEVFYLQAGAELQPGSLTGIETGGALVDYDAEQLAVSDGFQWNAGLFHEAPITEYISFRGSAGFTAFDPDGGTNSMVEDFSGFYAQLALRHRLNQYLEYTLSGGRSVNFAFYGGTVDMYSARWTGNWRVIHKVNLTTGLEYSHGEQLYRFGEVFDQYGGDFTVSRGITEKLTAGLNYRVYFRESDAENRDYTVHMVGLNLRYAF